MEITAPLRCSKCGGEFTLEQGGVCALCSKLFCLAHLKVNKPKGNKADESVTPICVDCHANPGR